MMTEMVTALANHDNKQCIPGQIKKIILVRVKGRKFSVPAFLHAQKLLSAEFGVTLLLSCGKKVEMLIDTYIDHFSPVLKLQKRADKVLHETNIEEVLTGENLTEDSIKILLEEPHEITKSIYLILKEFKPGPLTNIFKHPAWQESPFSKIREDSVFWIEATTLFNDEMALLTPIEHLENLVELDPNKLQFRSNQTIHYMSVKASYDMLWKWINFQFGDRSEDFVNDIRSWLSGRLTKKNGFEIIGEPNSGKSFFMQALIHLLVGFGFVKPTKGYPFNWDNVRSKYDSYENFENLQNNFFFEGFFLMKCDSFRLQIK